MNYYISDMHLNHKNVTAEGSNFDNRPFKTLDEMHEVMFNNWNSRITNGDTVYILGDMVWRPIDAMIGLIAQLRGAKVLIKGNHDRLTDLRFKQLFTEIYDYKEIHDHAAKKNYNLVLSHYPIMMWNGQHRGTIHLHGHVHNSPEHDLYQQLVRQVDKYFKTIENRNHQQPIACNVGCMMPYMDYTPRTLEEILIGTGHLKEERYEQETTQEETQQRDL